MKKKKAFLPVVLCTAMLLSACGGEKTEDTSLVFEQTGNETAALQEVTEETPEQKEEADNKSGQPTDQSTDQSTEQPTEQKDKTTSETDSSSVPVEYETSDGFMASFLLSSDRDKIGTTNDYGVFYRVVYEASLSDDELIAYGSMDYRNSKDQDPMTISSDVKHVFKVDDDTVYQKDGEQGTETISREEFAGYLESRKDSGMYFDVEISDGVVKSVILSAQ